ncbi:uncharacterized protein EI90DRAFT_3285308 [Cantharellus anzutake]|uniref:uncharacterized protein n=1 Tax=Cantharellus anzutake TaxID=1750568 RepID=UPI0019066C22|nr:uncharacterized protein EI90DRAFT_3285308 [Cantharellus anzutake]KAF8342215.1 hypothetical protein EI90DRAFT_3285308 [Cantharellus anzutake]
MRKNRHCPSLRTRRRQYISAPRIFLTFHLLNTRSFHTSPACGSVNAKPSITQKDTTDVPLDSFPLSTPAKSRKIELRPAPIKDSPSAVPPSSPSGHVEHPVSAKEKSLPTSNFTPPPTIILPPNGPSPILDQVGKDLRNAERHGILTPPPEGASTLSKLVHQAKQLFKFYWEGLRAQYRNHQHMRAILLRIREGKAAGKPEPLMTRWETQFIRTHKRDLRKLVPFVFILVILEEALPLIVLYAPGMLPSTTILPAQADRIYRRKEEKRAEALVQAKFFLESSNTSTPSDTSRRGVAGLDNDLAWTICRYVSLIVGYAVDPKEFCRVYGLSDRGPRSLVNRRLLRHLGYISDDDRLLTHEEFGDRLDFEELRVALNERGYLTVGRNETELRRVLRHWLVTVRTPEDMIKSLLIHALDADVEAALRN